MPTLSTVPSLPIPTSWFSFSLSIFFCPCSCVGGQGPHFFFLLFPSFFLIVRACAFCCVASSTSQPPSLPLYLCVCVSVCVSVCVCVCVRACARVCVPCFQVTAASFEKYGEGFTDQRAMVFFHSGASTSLSPGLLFCPLFSPPHHPLVSVPPFFSFLFFFFLLPQGKAAWCPRTSPPILMRSRSRPSPWSTPRQRRRAATSAAIASTWASWRSWGKRTPTCTTCTASPGTRAPSGPPPLIPQT